MGWCGEEAEEEVTVLIETLEGWYRTHRTLTCQCIVLFFTRSTATELQSVFPQARIAHTLVGAGTALGNGVCRQNDGD